MKRALKILCIVLAPPLIAGVAWATMFPSEAQRIQAASDREYREQRNSYISECIEARVGFREQTNGFYDTTTARFRTRTRELCGLDFDRGRVDQVTQAVRDGNLQVRGMVHEDHWSQG